MKQERDLTEARCKRASPGRWVSMIERRDQTSGSSFIRTGPVSDRGPDLELLGGTVDDQELIAHARQDVPALVEEVRRLRRLLDARGLD